MTQGHYRKNSTEPLLQSQQTKGSFEDVTRPSI
jgi:hypothetical protein